VQQLALVLLSLLPFAAAAEMDFQTLQGLTLSLQKVEAANPDGSVSIGTGIMVAPGYVVTNCHVTSRAVAINVVKGALHRRVGSQHADVEHDLCILHAPGAAGDKVARLREDPPRLGEQVHAIGFIFGVSPRFNTGEVNGLYEFDGGKVVQTTTPFSSGASGGGLFDREGRVVGIVTFKYRAGGAQHFALPVKWVTEAMASFRGGPVAPLEGVPFWQRPRDSQPYFLRAATLEAEDNWFGAAELAQRWTEAEPGNASAWHMLGKAQQRLKRHELSIHAYTVAVALDAGNAEAWYGLGLGYNRTGEGSRTDGIQRILLSLDPDLARKLAGPLPDCNATEVC
jgi:hypothetical protein